MWVRIQIVMYGDQAIKDVIFLIFWAGLFDDTNMKDTNLIGE